LIVALGLSAVLVKGVWEGKSQNEHRMAPEADSTPSDAEMKLTDMEYTEMQDGKKLWAVVASEARYFQNEQKTHLTTVRLTVFGENGGDIHMESREGILYAGTKNIELWGAVHAMLPQGYELFTERAFYEHQEKVISSQTHIHMFGPEVESLEGEVWEYRMGECKALLEGGVQATLVSSCPETTSDRKPIGPQ